MNKEIKVILLDQADSEYKKLNEIVGKQGDKQKQTRIFGVFFRGAQRWLVRVGGH
jgi:hypothetical protein